MNLLEGVDAGAGSEVAVLASGRYRPGAGLRKPQLNGGSNVRRTVDTQHTAGLSGYSMHHGRSETGSHARAFGGEERFGGLGKRGFVHAHSGVDNPNAHILARRQGDLGGGGAQG